MPEQHKPASYSALAKIVPLILGVAVLAGGSFFAGTQYQSHHVTGTAAAATQNGRMGGPGGGMMRGGFGTVTAVSDSSITIKSARDDTSTTYSLTSSTTVDDNGTASTVSAIKTDDTVMVQTGSDDANTATSIRLNPTMGGRQNGDANSSDSSAQAQTN